MLLAFSLFESCCGSDNGKAEFVCCGLGLGFTLRRHVVRKEKEQLRGQQKAPHINQGKGATLVPGTVELLPHQGKERGQWGS
jgi:hypothetical protein